MNDRVTIHTLQSMKSRREQITALTCYNYYSAQILDRAGIDMLLVGDSMGMVELGLDSTLPVTVDDISSALKAVRRGIERAFLVADMPYASYDISRTASLKHAVRFIKEGANAVKIEGGGAVTRRTIQSFIARQIPVVGHLGLTPQAINRFGGYRVQGRTPKDRARITEEACALQDCGVSLLVLECVPEELGAAITGKLTIPVIGIGAGRRCDGQILVLNDILGLGPDKSPRFVKKYADVRKIIAQAADQYRRDVRSRRYPRQEHVYP